MALVLLGAWTGAGKTLLALKHVTGAQWLVDACFSLLGMLCSLGCSRVQWALCLATSTAPAQRPAAHPHPPAVWFMGLASGTVAMASCTINDYFDADIDAVNDPNKPVGRGGLCVSRNAGDAACVLLTLMSTRSPPAGCSSLACILHT